MNQPYKETDLAYLLQQFFFDRLIQQQHASQQTVKSYRDTFRLLLRYAAQQLGKPISQISLSDIDTDLVLGFLNHLESERHNCVRSRNARLAAIRSFLEYATFQEPTALVEAQRILAIPMKRYNRTEVTFLSLEEMKAILDASDQTTWSGQRDYALLNTLYNTGARVSEIIDVKRVDLDKEHCKAVHLHGKGRKERTIPLWKKTTSLLRQWMSRIPAEEQQPVFPNRFGYAMSRSGVLKRLQSTVKIASTYCPSLCKKTVSPHVIRHTTAMQLLQSGVDLSVIALWLGHESIVTTHQYLRADLQMKEKALSKLSPPTSDTLRYKPDGGLLSFLDAL